MDAYERLQLFLAVIYPHVSMRDITISATPGFVQVVSTKQLINIKGAGYPPRTPINKLWTELHSYFQVRIEKEKNGHVTVISWDGKYYTLRAPTQDKRYKAHV